MNKLVEERERSVEWNVWNFGFKFWLFEGFLSASTCQTLLGKFKLYQFWAPVQLCLAFRSGKKKMYAVLAKNWKENTCWLPEKPITITSPTASAVHNRASLTASLLFTDFHTCSEYLHPHLISGKTEVQQDEPFASCYPVIQLRLEIASSGTQLYNKIL